MCVATPLDFPPAGGLCRDKVIEIIVKSVKDRLRNLHSSMKDDVIDKLIASLCTVNKIVDHDLRDTIFHENPVISGMGDGQGT